MRLDGKTAIIYGGGGSIGGASARAFAAAGATVHLAGRTAATLEAVAADIRAAGGTAEGAVPDATDEAAVDAHADAVAARGGLHVSMNVIQHGDVQGTAMADMAVADYVQPVTTAVRTTFLTWRAAARHMRGNGGGVLLAFGGAGDPQRGFQLGSLQTSFEAIESMRRQMAVEHGADGIRVVTLRSGGVAGSLPAEMGDRGAEIATMLDESTLLGQTVTLEEVGQAALFAATASYMTGATINVSAGSLLDR